MAYNFPDSPTVGQVFEKWTWNGEAWVLTAPSNYTQAEADARFVNVAGDTMTGHLSLPTAPAAPNAVRKDYVDAAVAAVDLSSKVSKSGDTMTGNLTMKADISLSRNAAPTTGYAFFGNSGGRYVGFDGSNYQMPGSSLYTSDGRLWGTNNFGAPLQLTGGTMSGSILTYGGGEVNQAGAATSIEVRSHNGSGWASMAFHVIGMFGANLALNANGNLYLGGWSHGGSYYQMWSSRDFSNPMTGIRLVNIGGWQFSYANSGAVVEPWPGAVMCGAGMNFNGSAVTSVQGYFRWLQVNIAGTWYTSGTA